MGQCLLRFQVATGSDVVEGGRKDEKHYLLKDEGGADEEKGKGKSERAFRVEV